MAIKPIDIITWQGRKPEFKDDKELTDESKYNAQVLCDRVNALLAEYGNQNVFITSGWRPRWYELDRKRSGRSSHCTCQAVDLWDPHMALGNFCTDDILEKYNLYKESLEVTHKSNEPNGRWLHLTTRPPASGKRTFTP